MTLPDCMMPDGADPCRAYQELQAELARVREERGALQRFKDYVHKRLDEAGVPVDPESPHKAAGCRIGGRLDWLLSDRERVARRAAQLVLEDAQNEIDWIEERHWEFVSVDEAVAQAMREES